MIPPIHRPRVLTLALALALLVLPSEPAHSAEAADSVELQPLAFLEPFMGLWLPHPDWELLAKEPALGALIPLNLQWRPGRRGIEIEEGMPFGGQIAIQGTLAWNPASRRAEFLALQADDGLVFRGVYEPVDARTIRRVYDVIGPSGDSRTYRETFRLRPDGGLDWTTERQVDGKFQSVSGRPGPEFRAVRPHPASSPPAWVHEHLASQIGRWTADNGAYRSEQEPFDAYRLDWEWGIGERSLVGRLIAIQEGVDRATLWEYRVAWHPADRTLRVTQFGPDGSMADGPLESTGPHSAKLVQELVSPDGRITRVGHRDRLVGETRHVESFTITDDGTWVPRRSYRFKKGAVSGNEVRPEADREKTEKSSSPD